MSYLAIMPGHGHRQTRTGAYRYDPGAVGPGIREADFVRRVAERAEALRPERVAIFDREKSGPWSYTSSRNRAHAWLAEQGGKGTVVHLHVNDVPSDVDPRRVHYLAGFHDPRSTLGSQRVATWVQAHRRRVRHLLTRQPDVRRYAAERKGWAAVANLVEPTFAATGRGVCAVLLELGFVRQPDHAPIWTDAGVEVCARSLLDAFT